MTKIRTFGLFLFLLLLSSATFGVESVVTKSYTYYNILSTWHEARKYCRLHHTDLAILSEQSDELIMTMTDYNVWAGVNSDPEGGSGWTDTSLSEQQYLTWAPDEPGSSDSCAYIDQSSSQLYGTSCEEFHFFYCAPYSTSAGAFFHSWPKTWSEAQAFCKIYSSPVMDLSYENFLLYYTTANFPVWIGLRREGGNWSWSTGSSDYRRWNSNEPLPNGDCVAIYSNVKSMIMRGCSEHFPFVCVDDDLLLVREKKTWEEAMVHCRMLGAANDSHPQYDLLTVQPGDDLNYTMGKVRKADTDEVWVGLRFLAGSWLWLSGDDVLHPDLPQCPLPGQHCGAVSSSGIKTRDCGQRKNFLCFSQ